MTLVVADFSEIGEASQVVLAVHDERFCRRARCGFASWVAVAVNTIDVSYDSAHLLGEFIDDGKVRPLDCEVSLVTDRRDRVSLVVPISSGTSNSSSHDGIGMLAINTRHVLFIWEELANVGPNGTFQFIKWPVDYSLVSLLDEQVCRRRVFQNGEHIFN